METKYFKEDITMSEKNVPVNAKELEAVYNFGVRCFRKGYNRACLEFLAGVTIGALLLIPSVYRHIKDKIEETDE